MFLMSDMSPYSDSKLDEEQGLKTLGRYWLVRYSRDLGFNVLRPGCGQLFTLFLCAYRFFLSLFLCHFQRLQRTASQTFYLVLKYKYMDTAITYTGRSRTAI